jgi:hypothetical protein
MWASDTLSVESDLTQERREAHELLDMLPPDKLNAVRTLLEVMVEPLSHALAVAPVDKEAISDATAGKIEAARASLRRGKGIPHDQILREFGLKK